MQAFRSCVVFVTYLTITLNSSMLVSCKSFAFANKFIVFEMFVK